MALLSKPASDEGRKAARAMQSRYVIDDELRPDDIEIQLPDNGRSICEKRYQLRIDGALVETVEEMFWRVAKVVAQAEDSQESAEKWAVQFYRLMAEGYFMPNSPTFTGAGTALGQLAACFVLPIADDMGHDPDGIFSTLRNAALIQQTGGGNGFSFSRLRHKNARVGSSDGVASGPVGFLGMYDKAFGTVAQGGTRRGANMAVLRVDHPDIREFITCKTSEHAITNFNISVGVTDAFMIAVRDDQNFDLIAPHTQQVVETVKAREIWDLIIKHANNNGEPGVLFLDEANRYNPVPQMYTLESTNPCGEQFLGPYENCCLGSLNLGRFVNNKVTAVRDGVRSGSVDWDKFARCTAIATRFLDNVVTVNAYVAGVPQLREAALNCRRIGLGFMGLGDLFYQTGIQYGSSHAIMKISDVSEFMRFHCMKASIQLAVERGPFRRIAGSIYDPLDLKWKTPAGSPRLKLDWVGMRQDLLNHGIRNAAQTTIAPTGTIATVVGCEGYGMEPVFALTYKRHVNDQGKDLELSYASPLFDKALRRYFDGRSDAESAYQSIVKQVAECGSCVDLVDQRILPEAFRVFTVSADITAEQHVRMQAAAQRFIDNSISKTCNFPSTATEDDVKRAYFLAWELGCKGMTVYREGSRDVVVLETKKEQDRKKGGSVQDIARSFGWTPELRERLSEHNRGMWNVFCPTHYQVQPARAAFIEGNFEFFKAVVQAGADPVCRDSETGYSLLEEALLKDLPNYVSALLEVHKIKHGQAPHQQQDLNEPINTSDGGESSGDEDNASIVVTSSKSIARLKKLGLRWSDDPSVDKSRQLEEYCHKRKLGAATLSITFKERLPNDENLFVHFGYDATNGEPLTCFVDGAKPGTDMCADQQLAGIATAVILSIPSSLSPTERLALLADHLKNIRGSSSKGLGPQKVCSMPDAFAKATYSMIQAKLEGKLPLAPDNPLFASSRSEKVVVEPTVPAQIPSRKIRGEMDLCTACGNYSLLHNSGCNICTSCGYSRC